MPFYNERSKTQKERDLQAISELRLKGWKQQDIADWLELSQPTVSRALQVLETRWKVMSLNNFEEEKAKQLERIEMLEKEYWEAWERSQKEESHTTTVQGAIVSEMNGSQIVSTAPVRKTTRSIAKVGDARFLEGIGKCIAERSKLLGLNPRDAAEAKAAQMATAILNRELDALLQHAVNFVPEERRDEFLDEIAKGAPEASFRKVETIDIEHVHFDKRDEEEPEDGL